MDSKKTTRTPTPRKRVVRPSAADRPTGLAAYIPRTARGRVLVGLLAVLVIFLVCSFAKVTYTSVVSPNYYENPAHELAADLVDAAADTAKAVTPDHANSAIDSLRESLTGRSKWANDVIDAEQYYGVDVSFSKLILAMIQVESGGDENVDAYGNIMEIDPGAGQPYSILINGVPDAEIAGCTPQASIFAGISIVAECIPAFADTLGWEPDATNLNDCALLAQGYNYGYEGWFAYCANNGITQWSLEASSAYQAMMGGIGTANHGQKIMDAMQAMG